MIDLNGIQHAIGDPECPSCWSGYPEPCPDTECHGLIHAGFGDENSDSDYWLHVECDVCQERF